MTTGNEVWLEMPTSTDQMLDGLVRSLDQDELFAFIVALDEAIADYDFTVKLRDHLTKAIDAEDRAAKSMDRQPVEEVTG